MKTIRHFLGFFLIAVYKIVFRNGFLVDFSCSSWYYFVFRVKKAAPSTYRFCSMQTSITNDELKKVPTFY